MAVLAQATGRVATGFSFPYVGTYSASGTTITYASVQELARGVSVAIAPDSSDNNIFYANNVDAERESGIFNGGTMTLVVDGLLQEAQALIMGLTAGDDGLEYGDNVAQPFCGVGFITRYRSGDVTFFVPTLIRKVKFNQLGNDSATQEEEIEWQTQELTAQVYRADNDVRSWKWEGGDYATEAEAVAALTAKMGVTTGTKSSSKASE